MEAPPSPTPKNSWLRASLSGMQPGVFCGQGKFLGIGALPKTFHLQHTKEGPHS